jgi:hypothetical protein
MNINLTNRSKNNDLTNNNSKNLQLTNRQSSNKK